jgi:VIT1/CCC1 family predicted Fe2+/Mn2+ transporter
MRYRNANHLEIHTGNPGAKLNWLRAAVLGANDGIISVAALVVGVAGAVNSGSHIFITGIAGLMAGALSMAVGEYVSVSSQKDTELALLAKERQELEDYPREELKELIGLYEKKGLSKETAEKVASELTEHDAIAAHAEAELGLSVKERTNPWYAAFASAASFTIGALIPLLAIVLPAPDARVSFTFGAVFVALVVTGIFSARMSGAHILPVTFRVVAGGLLTMLTTFGIGTLFGMSNL